MTTASLSGLLTRVGSLTDADVRELEKLADSYPYCQTAHLLLAKALHDRGSVLAGQKLRRAATGAPDRRALRRLLMLPTPPIELLTEAGAEAAMPALAVSAAGELIAQPTTAELATGSEAQVLETAETAGEVPVATAFVEAAKLTEDPEAGAESSVAAEKGAIPEDQLEASVAQNPVAETSAALLESAPTEAAAGSGPVLADFDLVPDTSPGAVDLLLFEADEHAVPAGLTLLPAETAVPAEPLPALAPDPALAYWLPSSRLGAELTAADFAPTTADGVADPAPAADLTHPWLALAPPDARWTEHLAAHQPPAPEPAARRPFDHQFALIDRFLREKPRLRALDPTRPLPEKLPDLALQSTRPDDAGVVSESIARILARQGKTARAVAMYEQLQARLPEKAAIFAAQIAALRGAAGPG